MGCSLWGRTESDATEATEQQQSMLRTKGMNTQKSSLPNGCIASGHHLYSLDFIFNLYSLFGCARSQPQHAGSSVIH